MPHALTYDTLPSHSRIRREVVDGVLRITASAEEPGPMVRRAALNRSAVPAGLISGLGLLSCVAVFGVLFQTNRRTLGTELTGLLDIAFLIFCVALFALIWRVHYFSRLDAVQSALKQTTILAAMKDRLIIETSGPAGTASHDLYVQGTAPTIVSIAIETCDERKYVDCLLIALSDGTRIPLLPGRDLDELRWVSRAVKEAIGLDQAPGVSINASGGSASI